MRHKLPIITAAAVATVLALAPLIVMAETQSQPQNQNSAQIDQSGQGLQQRMREQEQQTSQYLNSHARSDQRAIQDSIETFAQHMTGSNASEVVNGRPTVKALLGQEVMNSSNVEIAEVEDLLFNADGEIQEVVLESGGVLGIGSKLVTLDFDLISFNEQGDYLIAPLSEETIERMEEFNYSEEQVTEPMLISAGHMIEGDILNANNKTIATMENLTISQDGKIDKVIGLYGDTLGVGGTMFSAPFEQVQLSSRSNQVINVRFGQQLTEVFKNFKERTTDVN